MKLLKFGLRIWITLVSTISFLIGWAMLAHSPKPVQTNSTQPLPALSPLQPLNFGSGGDDENSQNLQTFQTINRPGLVPRFRTGGS